MSALMRGLLRYTLDLFGPEPPTLAQFRHPKANRESRLGEAVVAYEFKRGKRRTIGFRIGPEGLAVSAPRWVPLYEVEAALQEKADWILRKLGETRERQALQESERIDWKDGVCLPYMGESIQVVLEPAHKFEAAGAQLMGMHLHVALPHSAAPQQIRDAVQAWLMRQAKTIFTERLDHFAPKVQVQWRRLSLSNAGTRWGSARVDGSIRLNWRLVHFKQAVIDYVVVHELSHLRVMDHSPRFWEAVGAVVPDYPELRQALKDQTTPRWD